MRLFGLIGNPLSHSFSAKYFENKFEKESISDADFRLFPIESISKLHSIIEQNPALTGLSVTIPYKLAVLPQLNHLSEEAKAIGAVNCIAIKRDGSKSELTGYNTDIHGFRASLEPHLQACHNRALILGTGGAAKAVSFVLKKKGIEFKFVSRNSENNDSLLYSQLTEKVINDNLLIINTTPLGMYPNIESFPEIPYQFLSERHFLYDLVYNPLETRFLLKGKERGAGIKNGLQMLEIQAEKSWEIWNNSNG